MRSTYFNLYNFEELNFVPHTTTSITVLIHEAIEYSPCNNTATQIQHLTSSAVAQILTFVLADLQKVVAYHLLSV